jgi:hypothetical protein
MGGENSHFRQFKKHSPNGNRLSYPAKWLCLHFSMFNPYFIRG